MMLGRALAGLVDHPQHGGMQGVDAGGQLGIAPVHGQHVLGQVVGADRQEVGLGGQQVGGDGGGRGLDHHPQLDAFGDPHLALGLFEHGADGPQLVEAGDHRRP
jgi:hypothetical protein